MARVKLSPPWDTYYQEVNELFKDDPYVNILYDEDEKRIKLYVSDASKADALTQILPEKKEFGGVTLYIEVVPPNKAFTSSDEDLFSRAFDCNKAFAYVKTVSFPFMSGGFTYVVFKNKVVQYYTDNLGDIDGFTSTLYENIARDVLDEINGVYYCTCLADEDDDDYDDWDY